MKKNLRYGLIAVLILALLVVTGIVASAAGEVQLLDSSSALKQAYDTLPEAAAAAEDGDTISIVADLTDVAAVTIEVEDATIAINGNNHSVAFATGAGLTIGAYTTVDIKNVTLTSEDATATGITLAEDSYDLIADGVTITGFGTGIKVDSTGATATIDNTVITAVGIGIYATPNSIEGLITLGDVTVTLTRATGSMGDATLRCDGADFVINGGSYTGPLVNATDGTNAVMLWYDSAIGSHVEINGGTFTRLEDSAVPIASLRGNSTLPNFGGTPFLTINGGRFVGGPCNQTMFRDYALPIKGDDNAETFADIVINDGYFIGSTAMTGVGLEGMFWLNGPMRVTINDGEFYCRRNMLLFLVYNARKEAGHTDDVMVQNVLGGKFEVNSLIQIKSGIVQHAVINFGAPGTEGPEFDVYMGRTNNENYRGAIFTQNASSKFCSINFYSGTYRTHEETGIDWDGTHIEKTASSWSDFSTNNFIYGAGAAINFYGGHFIHGYLRRSSVGYGNFVYAVDRDQISVVNFLKNPGENGIVYESVPDAGRFLQMGAAIDGNTYNLGPDKGHLVDDPVHGNKVIWNIEAGTFQISTYFVKTTGNAFILNFGKAGEPGPTVTFDDFFGEQLLAMSVNCYNRDTYTPNVQGIGKVTRGSSTYGIANFYSGTYTSAGNTLCLVYCGGGTVNVNGGTFSVNNGRMFALIDSARVGELFINGGTFNVTGNGSAICYASHNNPAQIYKGIITVNAGTFNVVGASTGTLFILTAPNKIDDPETNYGTATFTLDPAVVLNKGTNGRYIDLGPNYRGDLAIGDYVFEEDPSDGLGGYKAVAVAGGYKAAITPANKVFAGAQMSLTDEYQLHVFWKLTDAQAAAYTKTVVTGIDANNGETTASTNIVEKTVGTTYPDGSAVESGYKVVEVLLPKQAIQTIGFAYNVALYVDGSLVTSINYSALEYLRGLSYNLDIVKAEKQAAFKLENPDATADQLTELVRHDFDTQRVAAVLVALAFNTNHYARLNYVKTYSTESYYGLAYTGILWYQDAEFYTPYNISYSALAEEAKKAAVWNYTANTNANLTGVGARFDDTIQLYVKFTAASLDGITVTYKVGDGAAQEAKIVDKGDGNYVAYTQFTSLADYDKDVTFTLSGDTNTQTCTYSITAFVTSYADNGEVNSALKDIASSLKRLCDALAAYTAY